MKKLVRKLFKLRILEKLLILLHSDKDYGSFLTKLTPNHTDYAPGSFRKITRHGIVYEVDISNIVDWYIYFGFLEPGRERLLDLVDEKSVIIDVGANIGLLSGLFAKKASKGCVYGFEPFPPTFELLSRHKAINQFKNLEIFNVGLGSTEDKVLFQTNFSGNPGMNRVTNLPHLASTEISIVSLDLFFADKRLDKVSVIKIDVEGFEFEVLKGGENLINAFHPALFIELDDSNLRQNNSSAKALIQWLIAKDYSIIEAGSGEKLRPEDNFSGCHYDIICV